MKILPAPFDFITHNPITLSLSDIEVPDHQPAVLGFGNRKYQADCCLAFKGLKRTLLQAPTGSGKSLILVQCAARAVIDSNHARKQIILVPMVDIGNGFSYRSYPKLEIDGKVYTWDPETDCCDDNRKDEERVALIKKFLLSTPNCEADRINNLIRSCVAISTYNAFLAAWDSLTKKQQRQVVQTLDIRIDEAHHIAGTTKKGGSNQLGKLCHFILKNRGSLHITTATFFRGDGQLIISPEYLKDFRTFRVDWMEHWNGLGLKRLGIEYKTYANLEDFKDQVLEAVRKEPKEPCLIILPSDGHGIFKEGTKKKTKAKLVKDLVDGLSQILGPDQVIDLISKDTADNHKSRFSSKKKDFSAVVTCAVGKEGSDWPACSRIHNGVLDRNTLQPIQKLGRALRRCLAKTNVKMINYIEEIPAWDEDREKIRRIISDRFNCVLIGSMLDELFFPIYMPALPKKQKEGDEERGEARPATLEDVYGSQRNNLIDDLVRRVKVLDTDERTLPNIDEIILNLIEEYREDMILDVTDEDLKERLRKEVKRRFRTDHLEIMTDSMILQAVRERGWDRVVREDIAPGSPFLGTADTPELKQFQSILRTISEETWNKNAQEVKDIGIDNIGTGHRLRRWVLLYRAEYNAWEEKKEKMNAHSATN